MRALTAVILVCAGGLTGACGVKGPLFVPGVPKEATWPYVKPKPASAPAPAQPGGGGAAPATPGSPTPAEGSGPPAAPATPEAEPKP